MPLKLMPLGVAEINWIEPVVGAVTVRVDEEEVIPLTEAVTVSVPAQPLSR